MNGENVVEESSLGALGRHLRMQLTILGGIIGVLWLLEIIDWLIFRGALDSLGVRPRTLIGLEGILFGPFLHAGFAHLLANTIPFLILGWLVMVRGIRQFFAITGIIMVISGLGIWLIGPNGSVHIGVSGIIFGYFGYLLLRGYFERTLSAILWSVLVIFLYGGMLWGVLPRGLGISWQAHLFGFIGGGLAAYVSSRNKVSTSGEPPA